MLSRPSNPNPRIRDRARPKGFTLLEVLLALALLGSSLVLLANAWLGSFARLDKTQMSFEVASLLDRKMVEIDRLYRGKSLDEIKDEDAGDFGEEFPQYSWTMKSRKLEMPDLAILMASENNSFPPEVVSAFRNLREAFSQAIKEVQVNIIFKAPKKNLEFSATTYFVNYDQELQLGLPSN